MPDLEHVEDNESNDMQTKLGVIPLSACDFPAVTVEWVICAALCLFFLLFRLFAPLHADKISCSCLRTMGPWILDFTEIQ